MKELKNKKDFIPLVVIFLAAFYFAIETFIYGYSFSIKQLLTFLFIGICFALLATHLRSGIISMGLFFICGWFGAINISSSDLKYSFNFNLFDINIPLFNGHPVILLGAILHFFISGKHYFGIGTKKYWENFFKSTAPEDLQI